MWALKHFLNIVFEYTVTGNTDDAVVTELFKGRHLTRWLARWDLTIREFNPTFKHITGRANVVVVSLSRKIYLRGVVEKNNPTIQFFPYMSWLMLNINITFGVKLYMP